MGGLASGEFGAVYFGLDAGSNEKQEGSGEGEQVVFAHCSWIVCDVCFSPQRLKIWPPQQVLCAYFAAKTGEVNKMRCFSFFFLVLCCASCTLNVKQLEGNWQAVAFYEEGHSSSAALDSVALVLEPAKLRYEFRSMGHYRESGPLRVEGKHLFLTDTTVHPAQNRVLRVLFLSDDTLKLLMSAGGKEQVLFLKKQ